MQTIDNQTNTIDTSNINSPLTESLATEKKVVPKRRFRLPHLSPRSLFVSLLAFLFLLVLGLTVVAAVKNSFKKAFPPTQLPTQPTTLPSLGQLSGTPVLITQFPEKQVRHLPESCYQDIKSEQCERELEEIIDKECGGVFGTACQPYYQEIIAMWGTQVQACQKDPNSLECRCLNQEDVGKCLGREIGSKAFGKIFCEMAGQPFLGVNFQDLCQKFGGSTAKPSRPEDNPYFGLVCSQNIYQEGCLDYCDQHPDELGDMFT